MTKVHIHTGSEGPAHDPYGYMEIDVTRNGHTYTLHGGLAVWLEVDGVREDLFGKDYDDGGHARFVVITGYGPEQWEKWDMKAKMRCNDCGCRKCRRDGMCARCGGQSTYDFECMMEDAYGGYL